jgi:isopentenyldiphosphate isomerase
MSDEILDIVDGNDNVIGKAPRNEIYDKKFTHRIVHIFVINKENKVYFQKRSDTVSYMPGAWCTSAGGHVLSNENYETAGRRELAEELGMIPDKLFQVGQKSVFRIADQDRFIQLYIVFSSEIPKHNEQDVSGGAFFSFDEAKLLIDKEDNQKLHPQLAFCFKILLENREALNQMREK